jgi:hypothetical protein
LNLLGHAEGFAISISEQYDSKCGYEMIETNMSDIGDQKSRNASQPSSSFSSTLDGDLEEVEKNGAFYYT